MKWKVDLEPSVIVWPWTKQLTQTCNLINTEKGERPFPSFARVRRSGRAREFQSGPGRGRCLVGDTGAGYSLCTPFPIFVQLTISILSAEVGFFFFFFCLALTMNYVIHTEEGYKKAYLQLCSAGQRLTSKNRTNFEDGISNSTMWKSVQSTHTIQHIWV